ncbi:putative P2X purinoceptor 7-like [Triplophysa rosa]|uniref:P2X purinoceptor 7-like n=1 Tax=Triplophysa rosa TaxID=992332 RepID=A0A9W7WIB7_TRIRA|nr:putative P2X purinoceptor 7-like [Triplophysa rosa]
MPTECVLSRNREGNAVRTRILQAPTSLQCMTEHSGLEYNCLSVYTLNNINNIYRADYGPLIRRTEHFRYLAYRSFVSWCWGYLGRHVRVVIPACVVQRIRQEFPDAGANYVGFWPPLD